MCPLHQPPFHRMRQRCAIGHKGSRRCRAAAAQRHSGVFVGCARIACHSHIVALLDLPQVVVQGLFLVLYFTLLALNIPQVCMSTYTHRVRNWRAEARCCIVNKRAVINPRTSFSKLLSLPLPAHTWPEQQPCWQLPTETAAKHSPIPSWSLTADVAQQIVSFSPALGTQAPGDGLHWVLRRRLNSGIRQPYTATSHAQQQQQQRTRGSVWRLLRLCVHRVCRRSCVLYVGQHMPAVAANSQGH